MILSINSIEKQYGTHTLFKNISLTVDEGHKVALVGRNGVGKSTLLKIIAGEVEQDSGTVQIAKGKTVSYLSQEIDINEKRTPIEFIQDFKDGDIPEHLIYMVFDGLGISQKDAAKSIEYLSGGQKTKILLTRLLLGKADLFLFDEPTNNLDVPSLIWLEKFLSQSKKSMIIVSHDITFLNNVANRVFELEDGVCSESRGTYKDYLERKEKEIRRKTEEYKLQQLEIQKLEGKIVDAGSNKKEVEQFKAKDKDKFASGFKAQKAESSMGNIRSVKRKLEKMERVEKPFEDDEFAIEIFPKNMDSDLSIEIDELLAGYKDGISVGPFSLSLKLGSKICIMGMNGSGKTTLLKTITGEKKPISGSIDITKGITFGDFMQQHERVNRDKTVIDFFMKETKLTDERAYNILKKFGISEETFNQKTGGLSAGTRARLLFAVISALGVNVLILDEPTNHLDIEAVEALKELLKVYPGIVILVSHNRWFLENIKINNFYEVTEGKVEKISDMEVYLKESEKRANLIINRLKRNIKI